MPAETTAFQESRYPYFAAFLERLSQIAPQQRRTFDANAHELAATFWDDAEAFFSQFHKLLASTGTTLDQAVLSYEAICKDAVREQLYFARTGRYSATNDAEGHKTIENHDVMTRYMLGLAASQCLWRQHYETFKFFQDFLNAHDISGRYLEIGPGHGFNLLESLRHARSNTVFDAVDLSQASVDIAKSVVCLLSPLGKDVQFHVQNILHWSPQEKYDTVVMGEVLEHVDDPLNLLNRAASFLKPGGRLFITTCANCPAIDHVYLFKSTDEIRALIASAGCRIEQEHVSPRDYGMRRKDGSTIITTQYAAVLSRPY